jgi:hypothetical protein
MPATGFGVSKTITCTARSAQQVDEIKNISMLQASLSSCGSTWATKLLIFAAGQFSPRET